MHRRDTASIGLLMASMLVACNGDDGGSDDFNSGFTTLETSGDGDGDPGDGDGDSGDGDGSPGDGDGGPGDGDGDGDPCAGIECSGHGTCVDDNGTLACACDDGYVAIGLECVSCPVAAGTLDIDIPMITVSGQKRINGQAVQASNSGYMYFVNRETGDSVSLGSLYSTQYSVRMIPGTYDLEYDQTNNAPGVPDNDDAIVQEGITLEASGNYDIDIPMITVSGSKRINGQSVDASNSGYMYFVNLETGDSVSLGTFGSDSYSVEMIPGTYALRYRDTNDAPGLPDNDGAIVETDIQLTSSGSYDIDIPMINISGNKRINGQTVDASGSGYMYFVNRTTGDAISLGTFGSSSYSVELIPGTYDLSYRDTNDAPGLPDNDAAIVETSIQLTSSGSYDIDIPMINISGNKRINGQTVDASGSGYMYFIDRETGDAVSLGTFGTSSYSVELIPGTYDLSYRDTNDAPGLPDNDAAIVETKLQLTSSGSYDIDIPMVNISGSKQVNGQTVMASGSGYMYFADPLTGDALTVGTFGTSNYSVELIPGTYDIIYRETNSAPGVPDNDRAVFETGLALQSSGSLDIDVPMVALSGERTINGQPVMASNAGYVYLINRTTNDAVSLGSLYSTSYSVQMIPGIYEIRYRESNDAPGIPENYGAILGCVQVQ